MEQHNDLGTKDELILYKIQTAKEDLNAARILFDAQEYKSANNRAYYAVFHAINAVHALDGNAYKRHKDAISNFNKNYVKNEIFSRDLGRKIGQLEVIRHASDYDDFYIASKEESSRQIQVAEELIASVEVYCKAKMDDTK